MISPHRLHRLVAIAEAVTWALLLAGMFLKYVTETTELGVQVFGMLHGVVFIAYGLLTLLVAVDQRWSPLRTGLGLVAAVPPFATLLFEAYADRRGLLGPAWRSRPDSPGAGQRVVCLLLRHHRLAAGLLALAVAALTSVALLVGPPA